MSNKYQQVDVSDVTDDETDISTANKSQYTKNNKSIPKHRTFWQWLMHRPLTKWPFLYFLIGIVGSIGNAVFFLMDNDTAFIICGILGASICFYGMKHFYTLLNLKAQIDNFSKLNMKFHGEQTALKKEVGRIEAANINLRETHNRLTAANEKNRENLDNFREIQNNMESFGKASIEEISDLQLKSKAIEDKWRDQLYEHERVLLHTVFERVERQGSRRGMNQDEFKEFEQHLPTQYRMRFDRMGTFHKLSKGDSLINYDDFRASLDVFAEMATDDVDIEFEVQKKPKPRKKKTKKQIKFRRMDDDKNDLEVFEDEYKINEDAHFSPKGGERFKNILIGNSPSLQETQSVDLEDIEFDDDDDDDNDNDMNAMYDRKIVITKRTLIGSRFKEGMGMSLFSDASSSESDNDGNNTPQTPGIVLKKHHFKVTDETGIDSQIKLKSLGMKQFGDILSDVEDD